jgi:hypothetical protein
MRLTYGNPEKTGLTVTLDEGESLGFMNGPGTFGVPCDEANTDYAAITARGLAVEPCAAPPAFEPAD